VAYPRNPFPRLPAAVLHTPRPPGRSAILAPLGKVFPGLYFPLTPNTEISAKQMPRPPETAPSV
jgi:hypothetical protein